MKKFYNEELRMKNEEFAAARYSSKRSGAAIFFA